MQVETGLQPRLHVQEPDGYPTGVQPDPMYQETARQQLGRVLASAGFSKNERLSQFLRFVVERHLEGRESELKESVIGVEVFGRKPGFDPKVDGIVRTEAIRLRARLDKVLRNRGPHRRPGHRAAQGRLPADHPGTSNSRRGLDQSLRGGGDLQQRWRVSSSLHSAQACGGRPRRLPWRWRCCRSKTSAAILHATTSPTALPTNSSAALPSSTD